MLIKELIELLKQYPQDAEIKIGDTGCGCCSDGDSSPLIEEPGEFHETYYKLV